MLIYLGKLKDVMNIILFKKRGLKESFDKILQKQFLQDKKTGFQTPIKIWIKSYFKNSKNYLLNYMLDIKNCSINISYVEFRYSRKKIIAYIVCLIIPFLAISIFFADLIVSSYLYFFYLFNEKNYYFP